MHLSMSSAMREVESPVNRKATSLSPTVVNVICK